MMGVRRLPAANETRLRRNELQMRFIAKAAFGADVKKALINPWTVRDFRRAEWRRGRVGRLRGARRLNRRQNRHARLLQGEEQGGASRSLISRSKISA